MDARSLRERAAALRKRAAELTDTGRAVDPKLKDAYTALVAEYDNLAAQCERMAADFRF